MIPFGQHSIVKWLMFIAILLSGGFLVIIDRSVDKEP
jgi:hypothetical protein